MSGWRNEREKFEGARPLAVVLSRQLLSLAVQNKGGDEDEDGKVLA